MPFNFSAGLSAMGGAVSTTAGAMVLEGQRDALEERKIRLANDLTTQRETQLENVKAGYQATAAQKEQQFQTGLVGVKTQAEVQGQQQISQNAADLADKLANDPAHLRGIANLTAVSATPLQKAQAQEAMMQAAVGGVQLQNSKAILDTRNALVAEQSKPSPDPNVLRQLSQKFDTLVSDPETKQKWATAMVANSRVVEDAASRTGQELNAASAQLLLPTIMANDQAKATVQANVNRLTARYKSLTAEADDARRTANEATGVRTSQVPPEPPAPMPKNVSDAVPGTVYQTARGPLLWNGTKLVPVPQ
jgi:hypothetical protein